MLKHNNDNHKSVRKKAKTKAVDGVADNTAKNELEQDDIKRIIEDQKKQIHQFADEKIKNTKLTQFGTVFKPKKSRLTYQCEICFKDIQKANAHIEAHMNMHKGILPYKCEEPSCDGKFSGKSGLRNHMRNVHGGFPCDICKQTFQNIEESDFHRVNQHGV